MTEGEERLPEFRKFEGSRNQDSSALGAQNSCNNNSLYSLGKQFPWKIIMALGGWSKANLWSDFQCPVTGTHWFGLYPHVLCTLFIAFDIRRIARQLNYTEISKQLVERKGLDAFGRSCYILDLALWYNLSAVFSLVCFEVFFSFRSRKIRLNNTITIPYQLPSIVL